MPRLPPWLRPALRASCALCALLAAACGDLEHPTAPADPDASAVAARGGGPHLRAETIAAGLTHACALDPADHAYCWGTNESGQLGDGGTEDSATPVRVAGGMSFVALDASSRHTCGLTRTGEAYCWGQNVFGQIGDGTRIDRRAPVRAGAGHSFRQISAGAYHTCALDDADAAWCWGANAFDGSSGHALGVAPTELCENPVPDYRGPFWPCSTTPVAVVGGHTFASLSSALMATCGLSKEGTALCWGWNLFGQLGYEGPDATSPTPVSGGHTFASMGLGAIHGCGIDTAGSAWCWGATRAFNWGQLGDGSSGHGTGSATPVRVAGGHAFAAIAPGRANNIYAFTCGVTVDGDAYCWGASRAGALGAPAPETCQNGIPCATSPVAVSGDHTFAAVSTGNEFTCGTTRERSALCWGRNDFGQLGNGTKETSSAPTLVQAAPRGRGR